MARALWMTFLAPLRRVNLCRVRGQTSIGHDGALVRSGKRFASFPATRPQIGGQTRRNCSAFGNDKAGANGRARRSIVSIHTDFNAFHKDFLFFVSKSVYSTMPERARAMGVALQEAATGVGLVSGNRILCGCSGVPLSVCNFPDWPGGAIVRLGRIALRCDATMNLLVRRGEHQE